MRALARPRPLIPAGLALALLATGCSPGAPEPAGPDEAAGVPVELRIAGHRASLELASGWAHAGHGSEHRFTRGSLSIVLADLGPFTPAAYRREIRHALGLFRAGQREDARAWLESVELRHEFADARDWRVFQRSWRVAADSGLGGKHDDVAVENAYVEILAAVDALETRSLDALVEAAWRRVDTATHRELARSEALSIGGREARLLETRDTLSHDHSRPLLFVLVEGRLVALSTQLGRVEDFRGPFDRIVETLAISDD